MVFGQEVAGWVMLVQKAPGQKVPVREELHRAVLAQEGREGPGQTKVAQEKGKVARLVGVVAVEWKVIVARALASPLALQLRYHGTLDHLQNRIPSHRQRLVVETMLRSMTLTSMKAEEVRSASWCLLSPALRYKLADPP